MRRYLEYTIPFSVYRGDVLDLGKMNDCSLSQAITLGFFELKETLCTTILSALPVNCVEYHLISL